MTTRRQFLKQSSLISLSPLVPGFIAGSASASPDVSKSSNGNILVVIQLSGGNDGINTVVPYRDEGYAKHRKSLRLPEKDLIKIEDEFAFHPRLKSASQLFNDNRLSVMHGVGYPNPNRSHFESMDIWHTASMKKEQRAVGHGWLGETVSKNALPVSQHAVHVGDESLPIALRGRRCNATSLESLADLRLMATDVPDVSAHPNPSHDLRDFVTRRVTDAYHSADELAASAKSKSSAKYPGSRLARRLKIVSQVIKSGAASRIYYTSQDGYDTHADQLPRHANLLGSLSASLKAFMDDLRDSGLQDRVLVMVFSEFGRRVSENASIGTDHGTAGPVLLAGSKLNARTYGEIPSLMDLESGDLKYGLDFRDLYAAVLTDWMGWNQPATLDGFGMKNVFSESV